MPQIQLPPGLEGILAIDELPDADWQDRWDRIFLPPETKSRLLNYMLFSLAQRGRLSQVGLPLHGLIVLAGPPGTGKTTLAGGLADQAARALEGSPLLFVDVNPHAFPSQLLGESQRGVARLFERTLPDIAQRGHPVVVLLDEVESMAVSRAGASLDTNPVDVHRATDALLAGIDHVARSHPNVTFLATTNHSQGVDAAFLSRADLVEMIDHPGPEAVASILADGLAEIGAAALGDERGLVDIAEACVEARLDGRQVRKLILRAVCSRRELALSPERLQIEDLRQALMSPGQGADEGR